MRPRAIVIHTVGVRGDTTAGAIRRHHMQANGWADIGYHRVVRKNGATEDGRPLWRMGAHTAGANDTLGICVTGDGDREPWTAEQRKAVLGLCAMWCRHYGWDEQAVCGHREAPARLGAAKTGKTCPGKLIDMNEVRAALRVLLTAGAEPSPETEERA